MEAAFDTCEYPDGGAQDRRLGRIWAQWHIPNEQRIALARNIKSIGQMANVASTVTEIENRIATLLGAHTLWPAHEELRIYAKMNWVSVWQDACAMVKIIHEQEAEARKDRYHITEIPDFDLAAMWELFRLSRADAPFSSTSIRSPTGRSWRS